MSVVNIRWRENLVTRVMSIIKKERVYYHWNVYKSHYLTSYWAVPSCGTVYYAVQGGFNFWVYEGNSTRVLIIASLQKSSSLTNQ